MNKQYTMKGAKVQVAYRISNLRIDPRYMYPNQFTIVAFSSVSNFKR